ncbi:acetate kinase [Petrocella sp. FN5]|uniref:acetate kinase n=1 Tax=Petrocella sp. FN5 TaxID=3032002 RepID=UPI0023D9EF9F|nr:acetate kinase [Petrocella sp. FN5]MDF1616397.1 acetate kinase [Petrocella sp. FN5]
MNILVLNCGSSSVKYQLINMENEDVLAIGICDRIGFEGSFIGHKPKGHDKLKLQIPMKDHKDAVKSVLATLTDPAHGVIDSMDEIAAVGHRVVHGGEAFSASIIITEEVKDAIKACSDLAPLHNPANLVGINACEVLMPNTKQVAVFDTAFHQTMEPKTYLYALPYKYYTKHKIRKYGFHGTSHKYVAYRTAEFLGRNVEDMKIVVCHLGNGASVCAIDKGKSIDTSMGLTPLEGLAMGTRSGDLDPAIVQFIAEKEGLTLDEVINVLNKESGIKGLSQFSSDFRDIEDAIAEGNQQAILSMDVYHLRVAKYIGAYAAAMNGIDAVVFTAGLGENNHEVRKEICNYLGYLGVKVDDELNHVRSMERDFSAEGATVRSLVIPTNEELAIARETKQLIKKN